MEIRDTLNAYFKFTCIQFQICKIDTIHDYNYFKLDDDQNTLEGRDVRAMFYNPRAINVYWVGSGSILEPQETFYGLCEEKNKKPYINISSTDFMAPKKTDICIQFYRYFGLPYTASYPTSVEFVNGSNGQVTADSIWDTPADPGTIAFAAPDTFKMPEPAPGLSYLYTNRKDPNGDYYNPMVLNPMSIYRLDAKLPFLTHEQYQVLVRNERQCRKRFWGLE
jgi:hypothetical protein